MNISCALCVCVCECVHAQTCPVQAMKYASHVQVFCMDYGYPQPCLVVIVVVVVHHVVCVLLLALTACCVTLSSVSLSPSLCLLLTHTVSLCLVISLFDIAWAILISKSSNSCRLSLSPSSLLFSPNWQLKGTRDYLTSSNSLDWINRYEHVSNSNCTCLLCWHSWVRAGREGEGRRCRLAVWPNCLKMLSAFLGGA